MTYDITTLLGALDETAERMANNLTSKGVTASFNEDILTLADKISQVPTSPTTPLYIPNARVTGAGRWVSDYVLELDKIIEFRFKNIPNKFAFGFGNASTDDLVHYKDGSVLNLRRNVNANRNGVQNYGYYQPLFSQTNYSFFCKKYVYQSGHVGLGILHPEDLSYWDYWECGRTGNRLIVQTYDDDTDFKVDIMIH